MGVILLSVLLKGVMLGLIFVAGLIISDLIKKVVIVINGRIYQF